MTPWFTTESINENTFVISEYRHWEQTHSYLLVGEKRALLIDTGLGICNISDEVKKLTDKPVTAVPTHIHWDHIGGLKYFPNFYANKNELDWLDGGFPLDISTIRSMVLDRCTPPEDFDINSYKFFQGKPLKVLYGNELIDIGERQIEVIHMPGHSPGHMCFYEEKSEFLFTGDLVYKGELLAYFPSTDPKVYLASLEKISELKVKRVFPAHHSLAIYPEIIVRMRDALRELQSEGKLIHSNITYDFGDWSIAL